MEIVYSEQYLIKLMEMKTSTGWLELIAWNILIQRENFFQVISKEVQIKWTVI